MGMRVKKKSLGKLLAGFLMLVLLMGSSGGLAYAEDDPIIADDQGTFSESIIPQLLSDTSEEVFDEVYASLMSGGNINIGDYVVLGRYYPERRITYTQTVYFLR